MKEIDDDLRFKLLTLEAKAIDINLYDKLNYLGIIPNEIRVSNVGSSNYSQHIIQPWSIWLDWDLNPFDADIIKRTLRTKAGTTRVEDYEKIIHICQERIRQIENTIPADVEFEEID